MATIYYVQQDRSELLFIWIIVIIIIAVIGALLQTPPESTYQVFSNDSSKIQYITIGGATTTTVSSQ